MDDDEENSISEFSKLISFIYGNEIEISRNSLKIFANFSRIFRIFSLEKILQIEMKKKDTAPVLRLRPSAPSAVLMMSVQIFRREGKFIDVKLALEQTVFDCHKIVLSSFSPLLEQNLAGKDIFLS